ncbi:carbohydrate ABC transporter permease [Actinoalloteichus hymeniacidonis]|uniref:Carbohydrate ABC transporter membrane protein 2, CUT1 family n=1 Tax=Actinoalloteichus hymeniacidonis TaxID=340345 RepID=A0AAC9HLQ8_9PSEU|nr:carbohydrate ABC transporter permease [Actinoalloteichus hymeniacidonis]AOS61612.1 carbohydrate ABC transporter membrane protein 2, CUT1 family [Actinoalloteichus hymeniacidonis]MBB5910378.1 multiple sugar transport system permease protein [Actinoalloteichus hymeniacidonis]
MTADALTLDKPDPAEPSGGGRVPPGSNRPTGRGRGRRRRISISTVVLFAVTAVLAAFWLLPLAWAVLTSFKPEGETTAIPLQWFPTEWTLDAYRSVIGNSDIGLWMFNSIVTAVITTILVVLVSSMAAYGFARTTFPGRRILLALTIIGIMVPPQVLIVPLFAEMVALGLVDTYWGIILPQVVAPAMVFILVKFFQALPTELEEAAHMDGASRWRIYWQIVMPLSRPVLAAVSIFTFISTWNNFLWPFIVTTDPNAMTLPVGLVAVQGGYGLRFAEIMAAAVLAALPLLIIFVLFQRQVVRGIAHTGLSGQ